MTDAQFGTNEASTDTLLHSFFLLTTLPLADLPLTAPSSDNHASAVHTIIQHQKNSYKKGNPDWRKWCCILLSTFVMLCTLFPVPNNFRQYLSSGYHLSQVSFLVFVPTLHIPCVLFSPFQTCQPLLFQAGWLSQQANKVLRNTWFNKKLVLSYTRSRSDITRKALIIVKTVQFLHLKGYVLNLRKLCVSIFAQSSEWFAHLFLSSIHERHGKGHILLMKGEVDGSNFWVSTYMCLYTYNSAHPMNMAPGGFVASLGQFFPSNHIANSVRLVTTMTFLCKFYWEDNWLWLSRLAFWGALASSPPPINVLQYGSLDHTLIIRITLETTLINCPLAPT